MLLAGILLISCRGGHEKDASETKNYYLSEPFEISRNIINCLTVHKNTLYYLSNEEDKIILCQIDFDNFDETVTVLLNLPVDHRISQMIIDGNGIINILTFQYDDNKFIGSFWHKYDNSGAYISSVSIGLLFDKNEFPYAGGFVIDKDGNACIAINNDIYVINYQGDLILTASTGADIQNLFTDIQGSIYALWIQGGAVLLAELLIDDGILDSQRAIELGSIIGAGPGSNGSLFFAGVRGAYDYDIGSKTLNERIAWLAINKSVSRATKVFPLDDERILWVGKADNFSGTAEDFSLIRLMSDEEILIKLAEEANKESNLTIGVVGWYLGNAIKEAIVTFNKENPDNQIEIKHYGVDDFEVGVIQLNIDIISGNCPDLLILPQELALGLYAAKDLLQDLNPYLDSDENFERSDYYENILGAYELNGRLQGIPVSFNVDCLVGKKVHLGDRGEWNIDEFIEFAERFPDSSLVWIPIKEMVLDMLLKSNGDNIIDRLSDDNRFNRELFIKIVEFSNRFMLVDEYKFGESIIRRINEGDVKIISSAKGLDGFQHDLEIFGEPVSYIGYPTEQGNGFLIESNTFISISRNCRNIEAAWKFIQYLLSDDFQLHEELSGYPLKKSALEKRIEKESKKSGTMAFGGELELTYNLRHKTDDEINAFYEMVNRAEKVRYLDKQIDEIIREEVGAYFSGNKTVNEVADVVENRVGIYIKEMK